jgi:hypothetical protein
VRIWISAIDGILAVESGNRDAAIVDGGQPHIAFADVEDGDSFDPRLVHKCITTEVSRFPQLNYHAVVLRFVP